MIRSRITSEMARPLCNSWVVTHFSFSTFALVQNHWGREPQMNRKAKRNAIVHAIVITIIADVSQLYHLVILVLKTRRKKNIKLSFVIPSAGISSNSKGQSTYHCQLATNRLRIMNHPIRSGIRYPGDSVGIAVAQSFTRILCGRVKKPRY